VEKKTRRNGIGESHYRAAHKKLGRGKTEKVQGVGVIKKRSRIQHHSVSEKRKRGAWIPNSILQGQFGGGRRFLEQKETGKGRKLGER